jgi:hypothetical protein
MILRFIRLLIGRAKPASPAISATRHYVEPKLGCGGEPAAVTLDAPGNHKSDCSNATALHAGPSQNDLQCGYPQQMSPRHPRRQIDLAEQAVRPNLATAHRYLPIPVVSHHA